MKKWQYAHAAYSRNHKQGEPSIDCSVTAMSDIDRGSCLYVDRFLEAAGERGWELAGTLVPFPVGKKLSTGGDDENDLSYMVVNDSLDIQWLIFKREM
jgi:hypothetical protein